jgi:DNA-binding transcriptional LysR family regulator
METGTATGAAARLGRTQPQISRLIADFEHDLGLKLFGRDKKRLIPTREGREFYAQALRVLDQVDEIPAAVRKIRAASGIHLNIVCQPYIAQALLPDAIADFTKIEPRFSFKVEIRTHDEIGQWLERSPYDLAIAALPVEHDLLIRCEPFAVAPVVAVLPRGHPLANNRIIDARALAKEPFIALTPSTLLRKEIDRMFLELGEQPNIRGEASAGVATCQMVARGLGVTLADPLEARFVSSKYVVVREMTPKLNFTYGLLWPTTVAPSELNLRFAACLAQTAKSRGKGHIKVTSTYLGT